MDDPTGGMWIYLIFFIIPLVRIVPRLLRKYRGQSTGMTTSKLDQMFNPKPKWEPEPPREPKQSSYQEKPRESFFQEEPKKDDGWLNKDDFK